MTAPALAMTATSMEFFHAITSSPLPDDPFKARAVRGYSSLLPYPECGGDSSAISWHEGTNNIGSPVSFESMAAYEAYGRDSRHAKAWRTSIFAEEHKFILARRDSCRKSGG